MALAEQITATKRKLEELERAQQEEEGHQLQQRLIAACTKKLMMLFRPATVADQELMHRIAQTGITRMGLQQIRRPSETLGHDEVTTAILLVAPIYHNDNCYGRIKISITFKHVGDHVTYSIDACVEADIDGLPFPDDWCKAHGRGELVHVRVLNQWDVFEADLTKNRVEAYKRRESTLSPPPLSEDIRRFMTLVFGIDADFLGGEHVLTFAKHFAAVCVREQEMKIKFSPAEMHHVSLNKEYDPATARTNYKLSACFVFI